MKKKKTDDKDRANGIAHPRLGFVLVFGSIVLLAAVIVLFIRSSSKTNRNPEHEFLALQEEFGEGADDISDNMQGRGRPLVYVFYDIKIGDGDKDYYDYGLFLFEDGTVWSGECSVEMLREMDFYDNYWRSFVAAGTVFVNGFSNWYYRGRLYEEDLDILKEEQKKINRFAHGYDWIEAYLGGERPGYGGLPVDNLETEEYHQFDWSVARIEGNEYFYASTFAANSARVHYLFYDEHSWFVVQNIKNSGFYKDWMQECFGDDWQRLEEFKDPDEVYEPKMTQCRDYYQSRMEELGYN